MSPDAPTTGVASAEAMTDQSIFEGLFTRVLKPEGAFAQELAAVGYDPRHPQNRYPTTVWAASLRVAARHVFQGEPEEVAMRKLGVMFIEGFYATIIGKMMGAMLPFVTAEGFIKRLPKLAASGASGIEITTAADGPRAWRATWKDANAIPEFVLGIMQGNKLASAFESITLVDKRPGTYTIRFVAKP